MIYSEKSDWTITPVVQKYIWKKIDYIMKKYERSGNNIVVLQYYINQFNASQPTFVMIYEDTPSQLFIAVDKKDN